MKHAIALCAVLAIVVPGLSPDAADGDARVARGKYLANGIARCFCELNTAGPPRD